MRPRKTPPNAFLRFVFLCSFDDLNWLSVGMYICNLISSSYCTGSWLHCTILAVDVLEASIVAFSAFVGERPLASR